VAGRTYLFQSIVNNGGPAYTTTFGIYTLTSGGFRVGAVGERFENDPIFGWTRTVNKFIKNGVGATGAQGNQGNAGTGAQGNQGNIGSGVQGNQGWQGNQGRQGWQGTTGTGAQGFQGVQGTVGTGVQGVQGRQGFQGGGSGLLSLAGYYADNTPETLLGSFNSIGTGNVTVGASTSTDKWLCRLSLDAEVSVADYVLGFRVSYTINGGPITVDSGATTERSFITGQSAGVELSVLTTGITATTLIFYAEGMNAGTSDPNAQVTRLLLTVEKA